MDVVEKLADFARRHREISHDWSGAKRDMHIAIANNCELAIAEITRLRQDLSTAITCADLLDTLLMHGFKDGNYRRVSLTEWEPIEEKFKSIASSIRSLKTENSK
jgi:molybdopterin-guanine dinucleotide biosynthesis protein